MINYWAGLIAESQEDKTPYEMYVSIFNTVDTDGGEDVEMKSEQEFNSMLSQMDTKDRMNYIKNLEEITKYGKTNKDEEILKDIFGWKDYGDSPSTHKKNVHVNYVETDFMAPLKKGNDNRGVKSFTDIESAKEFINKRVEELGLDKSKFVEYKTDDKSFPPKISQVDKNASMYQFKDFRRQNPNDENSKMLSDKVFTYMLYTANTPVPMDSWADKLATGILDANLSPEEKAKLKSDRERREEERRRQKEQAKAVHNSDISDEEAADAAAIAATDPTDDTIDFDIEKLIKTDGYEKEDPGHDEVGNMTFSVGDKRSSSNRRWDDLASDDDELDPNY